MLASRPPRWSRAANCAKLHTISKLARLTCTCGYRCCLWPVSHFFLALRRAVAEAVDRSTPGAEASTEPLSLKTAVGSWMWEANVEDRTRPAPNKTVPATPDARRPALARTAATMAAVVSAGCAGTGKRVYRALAKTAPASLFALESRVAPTAAEGFAEPVLQAGLAKRRPPSALNNRQAFHPWRSSSLASSSTS